MEAYSILAKKSLIRQDSGPNLRSRIATMSSPTGQIVVMDRARTILWVCLAFVIGVVAGLP